MRGLGWALAPAAVWQTPPAPAMPPAIDQTLAAGSPGCTASLPFSTRKDSHPTHACTPRPDGHGASPTSRTRVYKRPSTSGAFPLIAIIIRCDESGTNLLFAKPSRVAGSVSRPPALFKPRRDRLLRNCSASLSIKGIESHSARVSGRHTVAPGRETGVAGISKTSPARLSGRKRIISTPTEGFVTAWKRGVSTP
jgi:hypothetical protein